MTDKFIWTEKKSLSSEFCESVIEKFENDERKYPGQIGFEMVNQEIKSSTDLAITGLDEWQKEDEIFKNSLSESLNHYIQACTDLQSELFRFDSLEDTGYQIQRTLPGEFYTWHDDSNPYSTGLRLLTFIWYLNDVQHDGYTEFLDGTCIQPEQGKILIFPATWTYLHRGVSPKEETKYICTGWINYKLK